MPLIQPEVATRPDGESDAKVNPYNQRELQMLCRKAETCVQALQLKQCAVFTRDKDKAYFDDILLNESGIMKPYLKDDHGDPRNPINGQINGLFFAPGVPGKPYSIYGGMRLIVDAMSMVEQAPNLYFADFYCVNENCRPHYVQLVMTQPGTAADLFCQENLLQLNMSENPFFFVRGAQCWVKYNRKVAIELLFTDNIDLNMESKPIRISGRRFKRRPRPKNTMSQCSQCNIG